MLGIESNQKPSSVVVEDIMDKDTVGEGTVPEDIVIRDALAEKTKRDLTRLPHDMDFLIPVIIKQIKR